MSDLKPVYAVEWFVKDGVPYYEPRSQAAATAMMPRLWAMRRDAERVACGFCASKCMAGKGTYRGRGRVVEFTLTPVEALEADRG